MKIKCTKCREEFIKYSTRYMCKPCNKKYNTINKESIKVYNKNRYENNKEEILEKVKIYHSKNKKKIKDYTKKWFQENKDHVNEYNRDKYRNNVTFKLKLTLRNYLNSKIKSNNKKESAIDLIGCSIPKFKYYIQNQFYPEMNWDNHGEIWEIDHIKPCTSFDLTLEEDQKKCFHYTNLQPLFKTTEIAKNLGYEDEIGNRNKSNKII